MRLYGGLVNTACLVRASHNLAANVLVSVFLSRELVHTSTTPSIAATPLSERMRLSQPPSTQSSQPPSQCLPPLSSEWSRL